MDHPLKKALSHVFWIGGPANSGKSTVAGMVAWELGLQRYSYDKNAQDHLEEISTADKTYREVSNEPLGNTWKNVASGETSRRSLKYFEDRFPLVVRDLLEIPAHTPVIAEGIGFTPDLLQPILSSEAQAIWLIPDEAFMERSLRQKIKSLQLHVMREPSKTIRTLLYRDMQLAEIIATQVKSHHYKMIPMDGTLSKGTIATLVVTHFASHLLNIRPRPS